MGISHEHSKFLKLTTYLQEYLDSLYNVIPLTDECRIKIEGKIEVLEMLLRAIKYFDEEKP